jgi:hypothetical protein
LCVFAGQGKADETFFGDRSFDVAPAAAHVKDLRRSATGATKCESPETHKPVL